MHAQFSKYKSYLRLWQGKRTQTMIYELDCLNESGKIYEGQHFPKRKKAMNYAALPVDSITKSCTKIITKLCFYINNINASVQRVKVVFSPTHDQWKFGCALARYILELFSSSQTHFMNHLSCCTFCVCCNWTVVNIYILTLHKAKCTLTCEPTSSKYRVCIVHYTLFQFILFLVLQA